MSRTPRAGWIVSLRGLGRENALTLAITLAIGVLCGAVHGQTPTRPEISVRRVLDTGNYSRSVRLCKDPRDNTLYYSKLNGDVYRVDSLATGTSTLLYTTAHHGVSNMQGMAIGPDGTMYLVGNEDRANTTTRATIVKGVLGSTGQRTWSILAQTADYPRSATAFDHRFNGIVVSPLNDYLYINSGSRTDHGEIQTAGGLYPNTREVGLTAIIVRLPTSASNLFLPNDRAQLQSAGYVYAEGIRNSFDFAFNPHGDLFGTENGPDRDMSEELNWIRQGFHYGFPWRIGGADNPQQYSSYDPSTDRLLDPDFIAVRNGYYHNDPTFPPKPSGVTLTEPIPNTGPHADSYRDPADGVVKDASSQGMSLMTFTAHRSPLGIVFDNDGAMGGEYQNAGFCLGWSRGDATGDTVAGPYKDPSQDLLLLDLTKSGGNYQTSATRLVGGFSNPIDAEIIGNRIYVLDYGSTGGLFEVSFPAAGPAPIAAAATAPTIDGAVDGVWSGANTFGTTRVIQGGISSPLDCSGHWKGMWDLGNLYVLVEVTDDDKRNDSTYVWEDDSVELYLDGNNNKATSYDGNDRQYLFGWNDAAVVEGGGRNAAGVIFTRADPSSRSYRMELKVPWSALGVSVSAGKLIGLDVHVNDDDGGGSRNAKLSWHSATDDCFTNPSRMGTAQLLAAGGGGTPPPAPTNLTATAGNAQVNLSWSASSGAASYNVKRSTTSGSGYATVGTSSDTTHTDSSLTNGTTYYYVVSALNVYGESGNSNQASAKPQAPSSQGTFGNDGQPWAISSSSTSRIQAENYDTGGQNVAYYDLDSTNNGGQYRTDEAVDIEACIDTGGGYDVGWVGAGEWLEHTVNVAAAGSYDLRLRVARKSTGSSSVRVLFNGTDKTGSMSVPSTGGWQTWTTITRSGISLSAGQQVMRIDLSGGGYNVNWIELAPASNSPPPTAPTGLTPTAGNGQVSLSWNASSGADSYNVKRSTTSGSGYAIVGTSSDTTHTDSGLTNGTTYYYVVSAVNSNGESGNSNQVSATPQATSSQGTYGNGGNPWSISGSSTTRIQAENFDTGGQSVAYYDADAGNNGGAYRTGEDVDLETTIDTGGGHNVGWVRPGEWLEYTLNVQQSGTYDLRLRVARKPTGDSNVRVLFNGADKTGSIPLPSTAGWQTWTTITKIGVNLSAGQQVMRIDLAAGGFNFNWIELSPTGSGGGGGSGLTGAYFNNLTLSGTPALSRTDATVNFDWASGSPDPAIGTDNFSVRWTGQVQATVSGTYTFHTISDDGVRLWVNNQLLIDNWTNHAPTTDNSSAVSLTAGAKYDLRMEFYENSGGATAKLLWDPPGTSQQVIPQNQLFPASSPPSTGSILREVWTGISGTEVSAIPTGTAPASSGTITSFEAPSNIGDDYGQRVRGYLVPPQTGLYIFWIAADDRCELWLSSTDQPSGKTRIAYHDGWTSSREWNKYSTQKSVAISLVAGQRYYIEGLMKESRGGDNLAVGWAKPGQSTSAPSEVIPGSALSP